MTDPAEPRALSQGDKWTYLAQEAERLKEVLWGCRTVVGPSAASRGCVLSCFSHVQLFVIPWTVAFQAPLFMEFSRENYWSRLPFPTPGDLRDPGIKPTSLTSPASARGFFTTNATWEATLVDW